MGSFDLNNLLKELGVNSYSPDNKSGTVSQHENDNSITPHDTDSSDNENPQHAHSPDNTATAAPQTNANSDTSEIFVRNDPKDTPRPPDVAGIGLDKDLHPAALQNNTVINNEYLYRIKPDDGLDLLWKPDDADYQPGHSDSTEFIGNYLVKHNIIAPEQLNNALRIIKQSPGRSLIQILLEMNVDEQPLQKALAALNHLPFENINPSDGIHRNTLSKLGLEYCKTNKILPLRREAHRVVVGTPNPEDVFLLDEVRLKLGGIAIKHVIVTQKDINHALETLEEDDTEDVVVDELLADIEEDDVKTVQEEGDDDSELERQAGESPVIRYVNYIIQTAMKEGASDIHIEPGEKKLKVRFRIDGILVDMMKPPYRMHAALISRLKIMANLDIAERRLPQDGRIRAVVNGRKLDLRVSTLPTVAGEKCVLRILDTRSISVGLDQLGFDPEKLTIWRRQIVNPHGIILVTGPTGSGKTTTLYASLREMDTQRLNVSTVEDPVEYHLDGITQVQIHDQIGMSFAAVLRSLLRQDPDVVMLGEIRDLETSRIAIQASLTGHLVLSTLHTNDAPSSVTRLINIGVEPFLIGAAVNAVLAQRLVRQICTKCKEPMEQNEEIEDFLTMQGLADASIYHGAGCDKCRQTGYSGRVGIYELLLLDDVTRDAIARSPNVTEFRRMCVERGMVTLRQDGMIKVTQGTTTIEEVLRVTEATI